MANGKKPKNTIVKLVDEDGITHRDNEGIERVVVEYFHKLFYSEGGEMQQVLNCVRPNLMIIMLNL